MKVASTKILPPEPMSKDSKSEKLTVPIKADKAGAAGPGFTLDEIESLLGMLDKHDVSEFQLELGEGKISLKRGPSAPVQQAAPQYAPYPMFAPQMYPQQNFQVPGGYAGNSAGNSFGGEYAVAGQVSGESAAEQAKAPVPAKPVTAVKEISSPMVGTFYKRPAVDAEPYVRVGDVVKKGHVLCIIEAMKLMNEIESDVAGRIVEICLEDGQMVEYGEVLFRIEPTN